MHNLVSLAKIKHGHANGDSPTYCSWLSMVQRCENPRNKSYNNYGSKGIKVCPEWRTFEGFLKSVGIRPAGTSIGRILDMGNYEKGNAFWMTKEEQTLAQMNKQALLKQAGGAA